MLLVPPYEVVADMPSQEVEIQIQTQNEGIDNNMNISQAGVNFIKSFEGLMLSPYKPVQEERYLTIGYGHYGADVTPNEVITTAQAEQMLKNDLASYVSGVAGLVKKPVNQNQFDALVSFAYNTGVQALGKSTLLKKLNDGDYVGASNEFGKWVHGAGGTVLQGLVNRREAEKELFLKPVPTAMVQVRVISTALNIRKLPNPQAPILKVANKGDVFNVTANINDWHEVLLDNKGTKGYAFGNNGTYLELVK